MPVFVYQPHAIQLMIFSFQFHHRDQWLNQQKHRGQSMCISDRDEQVEIRMMHQVADRPGNQHQMLRPSIWFEVVLNLHDHH